MVRRCWAGLCGVGGGGGGALDFCLFLFFKQRYPAATSPIHSCGMERCFKDKNSMVNALTPGTCRFWNQECEICVQASSPRDIPSAFRLDAGQLETEDECKHSPTHSGTVRENKPDVRCTGLWSSCHVSLPGIWTNKYFLALAHS